MIKTDFFKSDWPLFLILDEVWLKSRRVMVHKLETEKIWPNTIDYNEFIKRQKKLGERIKPEILIDLLGNTDYSHLNSELIFGAGNKRFRYKLPYIIAFGYEMGSTMYTLIGKDKNDANEIAEICSIFNILISIFDYIHDEKPELAKEFENIINDKILLIILTNKKACEDFHSNCNNISSTELRILSKITIGFILKLHSIYMQSGREEIMKRLISCVMNAYHAEIASLNYDQYSKKDAFNISRDKSKLPFLVIYLIARLPISSTVEKFKDNFTFINNVGEIFWLIDDLVDVIQDLELNHLNSLLIQVNDKIDVREKSQLKYKILVELLNRDYFEEQVNQIFSKIDSTLFYLKNENFEEDDILKVKNFTLFYVRNWME